MKSLTLISMVLISTLVGAQAAAAQVRERTPRPPRAPQTPSRTPAPLPPGAEQGSRIEAGRVSLKLERGGKVSVTNNSGPISITGADVDTVEAVAENYGGNAPVGIRVYQSSTRPLISLSTSTLEGRRFDGEARFNLKVPRYAHIEIVDSRDGEIDITDVEGTVSIGAGRDSVTALRVGTLNVARLNGDVTAREVKGPFMARTLSGNVSADSVGGRVEVATAHGEVHIYNANADVRVNSTSGEIVIDCARGAVEAVTLSGSITLAEIGGNVDANTSSGEVVLRGSIRENGRYRLKSLSGEVRVHVQAQPPGFTATLMTYNGEVETDFRLEITPPLRGGFPNRRITGVYGGGGAQLSLDSFNGSVRILRLAQGSTKQCKQ